LFPGKNLPTLGAMAKQVLGRNLEALLDDGAKAPVKDDPFAPEKAPVGSGVRSLMRGHQPALSSPSATTPAPARRPVVPRWYLFAGDVLLAALALVVVCKSPHPLSWQRELFCAATVLLGGFLALGAVLLKADD
jgi:hypothetical protein